MADQIRVLNNGVTQSAQVVTFGTEASPSNADGSLKVVPRMTSGNLTGVQTAASGTGWAALPSFTCAQMEIFNFNAAVDLTIRQGAPDAPSVPTGVTDFLLPAGRSITLCGRSNTNQIWVRRADQSTTRVWLYANYEQV